MTVSSDEVRAMFDVVTIDQPSAPPDRASRVRRRVRRHYRNMAAGTLATLATLAALVALGPGFARVGPFSSPEPAARLVPAWALPWPDHRNGSVPQRVLNNAVLAWRHQTVATGPSWAATAPRRVIWYVGQTVARGQVVAVIFEVDAAAGRWLVAGWATATEVMRGPPPWPGWGSPWVLYTAPTEPRDRARSLTIGLNVHGASAVQDQNPDNWVVELAAPDLPVMTVAYSTMGGSRLYDVRGRQGLFIFDAGQLTSRVQVIRSGTRNAQPMFVGIPGSQDSQVPQLAAPAPLSLPQGFRMSSGATAQGDMTNSTAVGSGRLAFVARCYGPAPLRISYGNTADTRTVLGTIPCDGSQHELTTAIRVGARRQSFFWHVGASMLTAYRVALGVVG